MPRAAKPGPVGSAGNRTDRPSTLPTSAVPSKQYGQKAAELVAQKQVPMASGDLLPGGAPAAPQPPAGQAPPPQPGGMAPLDAPTNRPNEPVTAGASQGPGPGMSAIQAQDPRLGVAAIMNQLGDKADPATKRIRDIMNAAIANTRTE